MLHFCESFITELTAVTKSSDYADAFATYSSLILFPCCSSTTPSPPPLPIGRDPAEVRAETVSISQAKQTDAPRPPGSEQTINGGAIHNSSLSGRVTITRMQNPATMAGYALKTKKKKSFSKIRCRLYKQSMALKLLRCSGSERRRNYRGSEMKNRKQKRL